LHFEVQGTGFEGPEALHAPGGGYELIDQAGFEVIGGLEAGEGGVADCFKLLRGFCVKQDKKRGHFRSPALYDHMRSRNIFQGLGGALETKGYRFPEVL